MSIPAHQGCSFDWAYPHSNKDQVTQEDQTVRRATNQGPHGGHALSTARAIPIVSECS